MKTSHRILRSALALIALGVVSAVARPASATPTIAGDFDWATADDTEWVNGIGGGLRLGYELDMIAVTLTPEIGGYYYSFSDIDTRVYRGIAGARLRFLKLVEPGIYAHLGVGRVDTDLKLRPSWTAGTADGGISLDFTFLPMFEFGIHGGYNVQFGTAEADSFDWWTGGLNAALVF